MCIRDRVESLVFATALLILVFIFLFRAVTVSGTSMVPTLYGGDKIIVQSVGYQPRRGDVIVVDGYINYGEPIVKRIIGVGGDEVDIDFETATVTVNGSVLQEPYLGTPKMCIRDRRNTTLWSERGRAAPAARTTLPPGDLDLFTPKCPQPAARLGGHGAAAAAAESALSTAKSRNCMLRPGTQDVYKRQL